MDLDAGQQLAEKRSGLCSVTFEEGKRGGFELVEGVEVKELKPATNKLLCSNSPCRHKLRNIPPTLGENKGMGGHQRQKNPNNPRHKTNNHNKNPTTSSHFNVELLAHLKGQHWIIYNLTTIPPGARHQLPRSY